jgi:hypothetical protein
VAALSDVTDPEDFGLPANAAISKDRTDADLMMASAARMLGCGSDARAGGGAAQDAETARLAAEVQSQVAPLFDVGAAR